VIFETKSYFCLAGAGAPCAAVVVPSALACSGALAAAFIAAASLSVCLGTQFPNFFIEK
jgi:hypothetical protein